MLEATALPTEPQPLPNFYIVIQSKDPYGSPGPDRINLSHWMKFFEQPIRMVIGWSLELKVKD